MKSGAAVTSARGRASRKATAATPPERIASAQPRALACIEWLLTKEGLIDAKKVAEALGLENVERVYKLPLNRVELSDRSTRYCPVEVYYLARSRLKTPPGAVALRPSDHDTPS